MSQADALEVLAFLEATYREELPDQTRAVWCRMLEDLDPESLRQVAFAHVTTSRYFPSISELRALAVDRDLDAPDEVEAWEQAKALARARPLDGIDYGPALDVHPLVLRAAHAMGLDVIGNSREDQPWGRRDFLRIYEAVCGGARRQLALGPGGGPLASGRLAELASGIGALPDETRAGSELPRDDG